MLLAGTAFHRNAGTSTVTLLGLQPGEEYLVQIWLNDSRQAGYQEVLDGTCTVSTHPDGASYGQYAIGRFRADSTGRAIVYTDTPESQVRLAEVSGFDFPSECPFRRRLPDGRELPLKTFLCNPNVPQR